MEQRSNNNSENKCLGFELTVLKVGWNGEPWDPSFEGYKGEEPTQSEDNEVLINKVINKVVTSYKYEIQWWSQYQ